MTHEEKIEQFREEWKTATITRRKIIELQVRALKIAIEKRDKKK